MKTILSIDGGGMKGYVPTSVLMALEGKAGKPCSEIFDMVAGTSIGGICASLIAVGKNAGDVLQFFTSDGPKIFGHHQFLSHLGLFRPKYAAGPLEECLKTRFAGARLFDTKKPLIVTAFDLTSYSPVFFKSVGSDKNYALWEICRATSAAQTYFPAFTLDDMVLWDGGNVVNNPAVCAVAEAMKLWPDERLRVLSLGCGSVSSRLPPHVLINAGLIRVALETLGLLFDANDELPDYILKHVMGAGYFRVSPAPGKTLALDGCSASDLSDLYEVAHKCVQDSAKTLDDFLAFSAA